MSNNSPGNAFAITIENLNKTLTDFGPMVPPIDSVTKFITDVDNIIDFITDMINSADVIDDIIIALGDVLEFLDGIPIVGEVAAVMGGVIDTIGDTIKEALETAKEIASDILKPIKEVFDDTKKGLQDVRAVVVDISQKVPGYLNTVEILSYLAEIADPLSKVLDGTKPGEDLTNVLNGFNKVQDDLGKALSVLNPVMKVADTAVKDLTSVLSAITNAMGTNLQDVLNNIQDAVKIFQPITDGFKKLENAIKPLAWVLDALSCVFNKILKPVIDAVLEATGLKSLVDDAKTALMDKIGIGPVFTEAQKSMNSSSVDSSSKGVDSANGQQSSSAWSDATLALGVYRASKDGGTKEAVWSLVNAITGGSVDPNKPYVAPPFQPVPNLTPATNDGDSLFVPREIQRINPSIIRNLEDPNVRHFTQSLLTLASINGATTPSKQTVDKIKYPNCAKLIDDITSLTTNLDLLNPAAAQLHSALDNFKVSLTLPSTFQHEVSNLAELFNDSIHILDFFESLNVDFVNKLVEPIEDIVNDQNNKLNDVTNTLPGLNAAITSLDKASASVLKVVPDTTIICTTIQRIEGWSMSIYQTTQLIDSGYEKVKTLPENEQVNAVNEIDDFKAKVESIAESLVKRVEIMSNHANALTASINNLQDGLSSYIDALKAVSKGSDLISNKGITVLDRVVHILGIVNSIVDPLSGLLQAEKCVDSSNPIKVGANVTIDVIKNAGRSAATKSPDTFVKFAEQIAEQALPLSGLANSITNASSTISQKVVDAFAVNSDALETGLSTLTNEMKESETYTATIHVWKDGKETEETREITVNNDLFSQELLSEANNIIQTLKIQN